MLICTSVWGSKTNFQLHAIGVVLSGRFSWYIRGRGFSL
jgi:hypothetical protein